MLKYNNRGGFIDCQRPPMFRKERKEKWNNVFVQATWITVCLRYMKLIELAGLARLMFQLKKIENRFIGHDFKKFSGS